MRDNRLVFTRTLVGSVALSVAVSGACSDKGRLNGLRGEPLSGEPTSSTEGIDPHIGELRLEDWQPRSMLQTKVTEIKKPVFPVVDAHNHLRRAKDIPALVRTMDKAGVQTVVNLDGLWGRTLDKQLERFDRSYPGRFLTYAQLDFADFGDPDWTANTVAELERGFKAGAKGLKILKSLGLTHRDNKTGKRIRIDDPRLQPIWDLCGRYGRPVEIHTADPAAFFTPLDRFNERWHELNDHPQWLFYGSSFPSREELLKQRNRVIARHPQTVFMTPPTQVQTSIGAVM